MPHPPNFANPNPYDYRQVERIPGVGWFHNGRHLKHFKPNYAFVWPKDGKRGSKMGRFKDILTNSGPDIFVTASGNKGEAMRDRPLRSRWSMWPYMEDNHEMRDLRTAMEPEIDADILKEPFWVKPHRGGRPDKRYDFWSRKYRPVHSMAWSDARYGRNHKEPPLAFRHHQWDYTEGHPFGAWFP